MTASNVVITVPLANLSTGIGLRDHHMKEKYLEVQKYPSATLTIARSALKFPRRASRLLPTSAGTVDDSRADPPGDGALRREG